MNVTKEFISSVSVNETAVKNGADLAKKKKYVKLFTDIDQTLLGGECAGSGKKPYYCSADFVNEHTPVFRCSCPSRQIPCKHVIGLLWAFMEGHEFTTEEIPEDILLKRENKEKRMAKAKEKTENAKDNVPKEKTAAWKRSAVKKIETQLTGIEEAEKILQSITQSGLGSMDVKSVKTYLGVVKQLDSYSISGIQNELNDLLGMFHNSSNKDKKEQTNFMKIAEKLCQIHTLLKKSKTYLEKKKEVPDVMDTESEIEELIGYAWKLEELAQYGLIETDARLVQLCFHVRQEDEKKQFVEEGFYISLNSGKIYKTRNYRPYKALKYIKEEDSVFSLLNITKLYIYPSQSMNPRVRWEEYTLDTFEGISSDIILKIKSYGYSDFTEAIKHVKNQLKNLLLFPHPVLLVQFEKISKVAVPNEKDNIIPSYVLHDKTGNTICLKHSSYCQDSFMSLLEQLTKTETENNAMLLLFDNDVEKGVLFAQPLACITEERIIRLLY